MQDKREIKVKAKSYDMNFQWQSNVMSNSVSKIMSANFQIKEFYSFNRLNGERKVMLIISETE